MSAAHAAWPHLGVDTVLVGAQIVNQLQSIVARNVDPLEAAVISICMFQAGHADNVIPQHGEAPRHRAGLSPKVRDLLQKRVREVVEGTARLYGAKAELTYTTGYPVLVNEERKTAFAAGVAREIAGKDKVDTDCAPLMGAEDFAFMLQERPGAFIYIGNGNSASCTTRPTTSTTRRSRSAPPTGCDWRRPRSRADAEATAPLPRGSRREPSAARR